MSGRGRLDVRLARLREKGRKALVAFITAGDPVPRATVPALHALVRGGADLLELGIPFSDPEAEPDGLDFEGLNAISLFRQPMVRWTKPVADRFELPGLALCAVAS